MMSFIISWLYTDVLPLKKRAKKLVKVITPSPPAWMRNPSTASPGSENVVEISTGVRPVIHTADVATNSEST